MFGLVIIGVLLFGFLSYGSFKAFMAGPATPKKAPPHEPSPTAAQCTQLLLWEQAIFAGIDSAEAKTKPSRGEVRAFLTALLENGPVRASTGPRQACVRGYTPGMLLRAKRELGVLSVYSGHDRCWYWMLPPVLRRGRQLEIIYLPQEGS